MSIEKEEKKNLAKLKKDAEDLSERYFESVKPSPIYSSKFIASEKANIITINLDYNFSALAKKVSEFVFKYSFHYENKQMFLRIPNVKEYEKLSIKKYFNDKQNNLFKVYIENFGDEVVLIKKENPIIEMFFIDNPYQYFENNP